MNSVLYIRNTKEFQSTKVSIIRNMSNDRYLFYVQNHLHNSKHTFENTAYFCYTNDRNYEDTNFVKVDPLAF